MAKWISAGATCAAVVLSVTLTAAQTTAPDAKAEQGNKTEQENKGRVPDRPFTTSDAAKARPQATITGCVVRDAANGGQPTIASNGISYQLIGKDESELAQYLGKRVEVTGLLETGSTGARATSGKAKTGESGAPKEQTATGGQSDVTATGAPRDNTVPSDALPLATDKGTTADLTARVQVKTLRLISPNCL